MELLPVADAARAEVNVISFGAGVQSSTLVLKAARGEIGPMPVCALFADTGAEPRRVYEWLERVEKELPFPVHRVSAGSLLENALANRTLSGHAFQDVPWRTARGLGRRQCTTQYKILPLYRKLRELGASEKNPVRFWIGISTDEAARMKPARVKYVVNAWPLIEEGMSRLHCLRWLKEHGYERPAKSSCVFCPYKGNAEWRELDAKDFEVACQVDDAIRTFGVEQYAHRDCVPLRRADLRLAQDAGQLSMFDEACEGMCGV